MAKQNMPRPRTKTAEAPPERTLAYDFDKKNENTSDLENGLTGKPSPFTKWEGSPASGDSGIMLDKATPARHDPGGRFGRLRGGYVLIAPRRRAPKLQVTTLSIPPSTK